MRLDDMFKNLKEKEEISKDEKYEIWTPESITKALGGLANAVRIVTVLSELEAEGCFSQIKFAGIVKEQK